MEVWTGPGWSSSRQLGVGSSADEILLQRNDGMMAATSTRPDGWACRCSSGHATWVLFDGYVIEGDVPAAREIRRLLGELTRRASVCRARRCPADRPGIDGPAYGGARYPQRRIARSIHLQWETAMLDQSYRDGATGTTEAVSKKHSAELHHPVDRSKGVNRHHRSWSCGQHEAGP